MATPTASHAAASDLDGDQGFLTATNDRDVAVADLTGDGWLDVVTAVDQTPGEPKHLSHPRITINLGAGDDGAWLGLLHEDARFPELVCSGELPLGRGLLALGGRLGRLRRANLPE